MTTPYDARAAREIVDGITLVSEAQYEPLAAGDPFPLIVEEWNLTLDEESSPHATLNLTCAIPDAEDLALIDTRLEQRVLLRAGYVYSDESIDLHDYAHLTVYEAHVDRPDGVLRITAYSSEVILEDSDIPVDRGFVAFLAFSDVNDMFAHFVPGDLNSTIPAGKQLPSVYPMSGIRPDEMLDTLAQLRAWADSIDASIWCDQFGVWQLRPADKLGKATAILSSTDTVHETRYSRLRDGWANSIIITYEYDNATPKRWAQAQDVGVGELTKWHHETRLKPPKGATPTAEGEVQDPAAVGMLRRLKGRGDRLEIRTPAHLWLRVGNTITLAVPDMPQQRALVSYLYVDSTGEQAIRTRQPN